MRDTESRLLAVEDAVDGLAAVADDERIRAVGALVNGRRLRAASRPG